MYYSGTSLLRSIAGLSKSGLNGDVTKFQALTTYSLHYGKLFVTERGALNG